MTSLTRKALAGAVLAGAIGSSGCWTTGKCVDPSTSRQYCGAVTAGIDPKRRLATINCRIAKGSFALNVGAVNRHAAAAMRWSRDAQSHALFNIRATLLRGLQ